MEIFLQSFHQLVILLVSSFSQFDVIFDRNFLSHSHLFLSFRFYFSKNNELCVDTFLCTLALYFLFVAALQAKKPFICVIKTITNDSILPNFQPIFILESTWFVAYLLTKCCCCLLSNRKYSARISEEA